MSIVAPVPADVLAYFRELIGDNPADPSLRVFSDSYLKVVLNRAFLLHTNGEISWELLSPKEREKVLLLAHYFVVLKQAQTVSKTAREYRTKDGDNEIAIRKEDEFRALLTLASDLRELYEDEEGGAEADIVVGTLTRESRISRIQVPIIGNLPPRTPVLAEVAMDIEDDFHSAGITIRWGNLLPDHDIAYVEVYVREVTGSETIDDWILVDTVNQVDINFYEFTVGDTEDDDLFNATEYEIRIRVIDRNNLGVYSNTITVTTPAAS